MNLNKINYKIKNMKIVLKSKEKKEIILMIKILINFKLLTKEHLDLIILKNLNNSVPAINSEG